ncbi:hypothetical protein [Mangrovivirga cuniculi]|uniref:Type II secretion system protein GspG C-terminal domain-containing protein n=1 Tax=Mangrovivirga cuniculi TaxID=2715131 RepID=A0A4D7K0W8_9BACT|nr:hypothetical protein [Mangrovivirga cuniculi]QCK16565.1 hypothetical protein DCC35_18440 [Mangrovivirga cuniculi]
MKSIFSFIFSAVVPGLGHVYLKKYAIGCAFFFIPLLCAFILPIPNQYIYLFAVIMSLTDLYFRVEKVSGTKKALVSLLFSLVIVLIIIPVIFYLFFLTAYNGSQYVTNKYLNNDHTKDEMMKIEKALVKYIHRNNEYPSDFMNFVNRKPIWKSWAYDSWDNPYRYKVNEDGFILISAGLDGVFDTKDDIRVTSKVNYQTSVD